LNQPLIQAHILFSNGPKVVWLSGRFLAVFDLYLDEWAGSSVWLWRIIGMCCSSKI